MCAFYLNKRSLMVKLSKLILLLWLPALGWAQGYGGEYDYEDDDAEQSLPYVEIIDVNDLEALGREARAEGKVILLEMSASYCGYCRTLEDNIIKPMLRSGDYTDYVLIRRLHIDSHYGLRDFNGSKTSPSKFSLRHNVQLTPTLLFLDGEGKEVSERILGVNTLEMYGAYVDKALQQGHQKITR